MLKTSDYNLFKPHKSNRPLDPTNLKKIRKSIEMNNLLEFRPILVNSNYEIIDGNHRFHVAKELGLPLYYQVNHEEIQCDMLLLNANQKCWSLMDYIHYYHQQGDKNYSEILEMIKKTNQPLKATLELMGLSGGGTTSMKLRRGEFKIEQICSIEEVIRKSDILNRVCEILSSHNTNTSRYLSSSKFRVALVKILSHPDVDSEILIKKIEIKSRSVKNRSTCADYYEDIKDIYNWKNSNPI